MAGCGDKEGIRRVRIELAFGVEYPANVRLRGVHRVAGDLLCLLLSLRGTLNLRKFFFAKSGGLATGVGAAVYTILWFAAPAK